VAHDKKGWDAGNLCLCHMDLPALRRRLGWRGGANQSTFAGRIKL